MRRTLSLVVCLVASLAAAQGTSEYGNGLRWNVTPEGDRYIRLITWAQVWTRAEERFTAAIADAQASNTADILAMAYLGRARARLNQARFPEAAADARQIPANFVRNATFL